MTRSLLAAIRASLMPGEADPILEEDQPGAMAPTPEASPTRANQEEDTMSDPSTTPAGGASQAAAGETSNDAAITAAGLAGEEKGAKVANDRMVTILGAEGIKGDGKRMSAALDLAINSPGMGADQVTTFVKQNVAAAAATDGDGATQHDRRRAAATPHVQPDKGGARGDNMRVDITADMKRRHNVN